MRLVDDYLEEGLPFLTTLYREAKIMKVTTVQIYYQILLKTANKARLFS